MAWGGKREGAGRKPSKRPNPNARERRDAEPKVIPPTPRLPAEPRKEIDTLSMMQLLPEIEKISRQYAQRKYGEDRARLNPFVLPKFPKIAMPNETEQMAQDSALAESFGFGGQEWLAGNYIGGVAAEGMLFLGYTYLSELAQRPEYRVISETIADDATRRWIDFDVTGDEAEKLDRARRAAQDPDGEAERQADPDEKKKRLLRAGKMDKIKALRDDQERMEVKARFYEQARNDGFFGRSHLFLEIDTNGNGANDPNELALPIGTGRDDLSRGKVPKGSFKSMRTIEPVWTYPLAYNAVNPLAADWYNPQNWYVMGQKIHVSRLATFIGHPVPDMLKPAYAFGGLSLSQMAKPYIDIWLTTRESVAALIHSFSVMVLMTDLSTLMQPNNAGALLARVAMFNMLRDNQGTFVVNKNTEDFKNVSASLSGLHELQAQAQEHMASVSRIPLVKLTGIQPAGLNASSEGEIKVYDDTIAAYQERFFRPNLTRVINFEQLSLFGEIDPEITWSFQPLRVMTEAEKAQARKDDADAADKYVAMGAISPGEVRAGLVDDPESPWNGLDPDAIPEPPGGDDGFGGGDGDNDPGGEGGPEPKPGQNDNPDGGEAADETLDPFSPARDAEWQESDHPRAPDGKFGTGGSSTKKTKKTRNAPDMGSGKAESSIGAPLSVKGLKRVGEQMGSNPGGVFANASGQRFYVKKPQSKAHVRNEMLAAALYDLAGAPILKYRPVEGGEYVATEMAKLDKSRAAQLSPEELAAAREDFMVHAWLGNYDAVGTGGDNLGTVNGVPTALDLGGALAYRARGAPKGEKFGDTVTEVETMRDPSIAPDAAKVFGPMTGADLRRAAEKVTRISDADIRKVVEQIGESAAMADKLIARKQDIASRFDLQAADESKFEESKHPRAPDGKFTSGGGGSSSGIAMSDIATLLAKKPIAGANYRKALVKALAAAPNNSVQKQKLAENLVTSWAKTAVNAVKKGDTKTAAKIAEKIGSIGKKYGLGTDFLQMAQIDILTAEPEPGAEKTKAAPSAGAVKKQVEQTVKATEALPPPTPEELKKAQKATPTSVSLLGGPTSGPFSATASEIVEKFNAKYAQKQITDQPALIQKVNDFKALKAGMAELTAANQKYQAELAEKAKAAAAEAAKAAAAKAAAEAARAAEKNKAVMAELGISEQQAEGVVTLAKMLGAKTGDIVDAFKNYAKEAETLGYPISGFQCALIKNYSNGGYHAVNGALRSGAWTPAQHAYVSMVNKALMAMPAYTGSLSRGATLTAEQQARYKEGFIVQEHAFTSTAKKGEGFGGNTRFKITAIGKRGADIKKLSNYPNENEVLYAARTFFKVTKVEGKPGGAMTIHMEEWEEH